jgi:tetratricopeptide (TPR) repeat protein
MILKVTLITLLLLVNSSLFAQNMGITSTISMQKSNNSAAPVMPGMNMKMFSSKLRAARTYIDQGNYKEALNLLKLASKQQKTAKLYDYWGDAYSADRQYAKAVTAYRKAFNYYILNKNKKSATKIFHSLRFYETDKTKSFNNKLEKLLHSL